MNVYHFRFSYLYLTLTLYTHLNNVHTSTPISIIYYIALLALGFIHDT